MKAAKPFEVARPENKATFSDLNEARYATPGTPENRAYHAKLAEIHRMALEIRKGRGRK